MLRCADGAADTFESLAYHKTAGRGRRVAEARGLVRLGNRGEPAGDGARRQSGCAVRKVEGHRIGRRGKRRQLVITAPGLEVTPVVSVSLECRGGLGCGNEGLRLLDEFFETRWFRDKSMNMRMHGGFP